MHKGRPAAPMVQATARGAAHAAAHCQSRLPRAAALGLALLAAGAALPLSLASPPPGRSGLKLCRAPVLLQPHACLLGHYQLARLQADAPHRLVQKPPPLAVNHSQRRVVAVEPLRRKATIDCTECQVFLLRGL